MNWLTNYVRPKIRQLVRPKDVPENLWMKCPSCGHMIFHKELERALRVCSHCGHHMRLSAVARLAMLFDGGSWQRIELPRGPVDPLRFRDVKRYVDRLREAQARTGENDAIIVAHGTVGGLPTVIAVLNFDFLGGSMGVDVGEGIVAAAELAILQEAPLVVVPASAGARMQEGILSLMQMARTTVAVERIKDRGLPYIVILTDPTTGGVSASFAMLGDIAIAEPGAVVGFSGTRVLEQTMRDTLPEDFQRAEYLLDHGMVDMVVPRDQLRETLIRLLRLLRQPRPSGEVVRFGRGEDGPESSRVFPLPGAGVSRAGDDHAVAQPPVPVPLGPDPAGTDPTATATATATGSAADTKSGGPHPPASSQ